MRIVPGSTLMGLQIEMRQALLACEDVYHRVGKDFVVTCGTNGTHSAGSLHYYGYAIDIRKKHLSQEELVFVLYELKDRLGADFDVVDETDHIHIEYDKILDRVG